MNVTLDAEKHEYTVAGIVVPGVTEILKDTIGLPWLADRWYLERGRAIHACAAFIARGQHFEADERIDGYISAIRKWYADYRPEVIAVERCVHSLAFQYAGTLDLACNIGIKFVLPDFKSGSMDAERVRLQCGGYAHAWAEMNRFSGIIYGLGIQLNDDGTYTCDKLINLGEYRKKFLACRTVYGLKQQINGSKTND